MGMNCLQQQQNQQENEHEDDADEKETNLVIIVLAEGESTGLCFLCDDHAIHFMLRLLVLAQGMM